MANQPQPFRHHHIVRAFKAAEAAGVRNPTVQVSLPNGTTIAIGGDKPDEIVSTRVGGRGTKPSARSTEVSKRARK